MYTDYNCEYDVFFIAFPSWVCLILGKMIDYMQTFGRRYSRYLFSPIGLPWQFATSLERSEVTYNRQDCSAYIEGCRVWSGVQSFYGARFLINRKGAKVEHATFGIVSIRCFRKHLVRYWHPLHSGNIERSKTIRSMCQPKALGDSSPRGVSKSV